MADRCKVPVLLAAHRWCDARSARRAPVSPEPCPELGTPALLDPGKGFGNMLLARAATITQQKLSMHTPTTATLDEA